MENLAGSVDPQRGISMRCVMCLFSKADEESLRFHKLEYIELENVEHAITRLQTIHNLCNQMRSSSTEKRSRFVDRR